MKGVTMRTPAQQAETLIVEAEAEFEKKNFRLAYRLTMRALKLRRAVETYPAPAGFPVQGDTARDHRLFTDVMRRAFVLLLKLGKTEKAKGAYEAALIWSDDPECSSKRLFDLIQSDWNNRFRYDWVGRAARYPKPLQWLMTQFA
jgi:hypothetical protein